MKYPPDWFKNWFNRYVFSQNDDRFQVGLLLRSNWEKIRVFRNSATQMAHTAYVKGVADERAMQAKARGEKESDMSTKLIDTVVEQLKVMEGFRARAYLDTEDNWTIGYGTLMSEMEIDELIGLMLMRRSLPVAVGDARMLFPSFDNLSLLRQSVLVNMAYNLGRGGLSGFVKFQRAMAAEDFARAAREMLDSKWARQVGHRAVELAWMIEYDEVYKGGE